MSKINCHVIYVLQLDDKCWYVGWTTSFCFKKRMKDHWESDRKGAMWTRMHRPVRVFSIDNYDRSMTDPEIAHIEDETTLKFARRYGYDVVRGGGYCQQVPQWPVEVAKPRRSRKHKSNNELRAIARAKRELKASSKALGA